MSSQPARPPASSALLDGLNAHQRDAVQHFEGPCLVLAGAGSGKTRVLTTRLCRLICEHGVAPSRIMAVTFTNKAAGEMRDRVSAMLGAEPAGAWIGTFHSLGARLLRRHAPLAGLARTFSILDAEQSLRQVRRAAEEARIDPKLWARTVRNLISDAKNQLVEHGEFAELHEASTVTEVRYAARVYPLYRDLLQAQDAVDFDDLLLLPARLLETNDELLERYRRQFAFVLVDEYQDTNHAQFRLLRLLAAARGNLMAVGDDDQSIYGWRGADIRNILGFERSFPGAKVVRLEQNYRSTQVILDAANAVIRHNQHRRAKTLHTDRKGGEAVTCVLTADERDEARWIVREIEQRMLSNPALDHRDFAVLYRTNAQARALEDGFLRRGVPYQVVGGVRFYERREIQDVLAYLRLASNPLDRDAFERAVKYPRRGVGRVTLDRVFAVASESGAGCLQVAEEADRIGGFARAGARGLVRFAGLVRRYRQRAAEVAVGVLLDELVEELDLLPLLRGEGPDGNDRADNVRELIDGAKQFRAEPAADGDTDGDAFTDLDLFLQQVALVADVDRHDSAADAVTLMTLHSAKGLEFRVVFMSGMEEGLFPLARAYDEEHLLEEERRLCYVGVTRAREKLYLTRAARRRRAGEVSFATLSSFVRLMEGLETEATDYAAGYVDSFPAGRAADPGAFQRDGRDSFRRDGRDAGFGDLNQDRPAYYKGARVRHETFGSGTILEVTGFGPDTKVAVRFDVVGRKKLLLRYAKLERDDF